MDLLIFLFLIFFTFIFGILITYRFLTNMSIELKLKMKRIFNSKKNWGMLYVKRAANQFTKHIIAFDEPTAKLENRSEAYNLNPKYVYSYSGFPVAFAEEGSADLQPFLKNAWSESELNITPTDLSIGMFKAEQNGWLDFKDSNKNVILMLGLIGVLLIIQMMLTYFQGGAIANVDTHLQVVQNQVGNLTSSVNTSIFIPAR